MRAFLIRGGNAFNRSAMSCLSGFACQIHPTLRYAAISKAKEATMTKNRTDMFSLLYRAV